MPSNKKIVIYGATGAIGTGMIEIMSKKQPEWTILAASRSGGSSSHLATLKLPNVQMVKGNVEDLKNTCELTNDADMVYCCIGYPQYEAKYWGEHWPIVAKNLLEVTSASRPLVFCDNLYAYGPTTNITTKTDTVPANLTTKPGTRATIRKLFQTRMDEDPQAIVVVGGADFFGPRLEGKTVLGDPFLGKIASGKKPMALGSASKLHDFCYVRDFSNALYVVSTSGEKGFGKFWICPHSIHGKSLKDLAIVVHEMNGTTNKGVTVLPKLMIKMLGAFDGFMSEFKEMLPFWMNDYTITGDAQFTKVFGVEGTPLTDALRETLDYYKNQARQGAGK
jgi:nucleoside-diphosphate-sugar epimerase